MTKQEEIRAQIIAAQAARELAAHPNGRPKARPNWAASPAIRPQRRMGRRPTDK